MDVYIYDMVIKSLDEKNYCEDLKYISSYVRKYNMHLNLKI